MGRQRRRDREPRAGVTSLGRRPPRRHRRRSWTSSGTTIRSCDAWSRASCPIGIAWTTCCRRPTCGPSESLGSFRGDAELGTWLHRIAVQLLHRRAAVRPSSTATGRGRARPGCRGKWARTPGRGPGGGARRARPPAGGPASAGAARRRQRARLHRRRRGARRAARDRRLPSVPSPSHPARPARASTRRTSMTADRDPLVGALLDVLPVDPPGPRFWDDLHARLRDEATTAAGRAPAPGDLVELPVTRRSQDHRQRPGRRRVVVVVLAAAAAVLVAVVVGSALRDDRDPLDVGPVAVLRRHRTGPHGDHGPAHHARGGGAGCRPAAGWGPSPPAMRKRRGRCSVRSRGRASVAEPRSTR